MDSSPLQQSTLCLAAPVPQSPRTDNSHHQDIVVLLTDKRPSTVSSHHSAAFHCQCQTVVTVQSGKAPGDSSLLNLRGSRTRLTRVAAVNSIYRRCNEHERERRRPSPRTSPLFCSCVDPILESEAETTFKLAAMQVSLWRPIPCLGDRTPTANSMTHTGVLIKK